jgi:hypothetical protein
MCGSLTSPGPPVGWTRHLISPELAGKDVVILFPELTGKNVMMKMWPSLRIPGNYGL